MKVQRDHPMARAHIPSRKKILEHEEMIRNQYQYIQEVWCAMDRLKPILEESGDLLMREQFYNGWTHGHHVTSGFASVQTELSRLLLIILHNMNNCGLSKMSATDLV